jgi:hypothetical protein
MRDGGTVADPGGKRVRTRTKKLPGPSEFFVLSAGDLGDANNSVYRVYEGRDESPGKADRVTITQESTAGPL